MLAFEVILHSDHSVTVKIVGFGKRRHEGRVFMPEAKEENAIITQLDDLYKNQREHIYSLFDEYESYNLDKENQKHPFVKQLQQRFFEGDLQYDFIIDFYIAMSDKPSEAAITGNFSLESLLKNLANLIQQNKIRTLILGMAWKIYITPNIIFDAFAGKKFPERLQLNGMRCNSDFMLADNAQEVSAVKELTLERCICNEVAYQYITARMNDLRLRVIALAYHIDGDINVHVSGLKALFNLLGKDQCEVTNFSLDLTFENTHRVAKTSLISEAKQNRSVVNFHLNGLYKWNVVELVAALQLSNVSTLSLVNCAIGVENVAPLARVFANNSIRQLTLSRNEIADTKLFDSVSRTVEILELDDNLIQDAGLQHLSNQLQNNANLYRLAVNDNLFGDVAIHHLVTILLQNKSLIEFDFSSNTERLRFSTLAILSSLMSRNFFMKFNLGMVTHDCLQLISQLLKQHKYLDIFASWRVSDFGIPTQPLSSDDIKTHYTIPLEVNQLCKKKSIFNWAKISIVLAFIRANNNHPFQNSVFALIFIFLKYANIHYPHDEKLHININKFSHSLFFVNHLRLALTNTASHKRKKPTTTEAHVKEGDIAMDVDFSTKTM